MHAYTILTTRPPAVPWRGATLSTPAADLDSPWKEALEEYLQECFALFFPAIHAAIDWSRPPEFLDNEFQQAVREAEIGRRVVDKLVRVWRRDGHDAWVLVHVEVQSQQEHDFSKRMYVYHYRIFDRHDCLVVSLALLADDCATWRPAEYTESLWGCTLEFHYPAIKLTDWRARRHELEASDNPFATVVLAHLAAQETRGNMAGREQIKLRLVRLLYDRGYSRARIVSLFRFIDWLLALPAEAESRIRRAIAEIEEEQRMPYITSIERMGREEGLAQGREEGLTRGRVEAKRTMLRRQAQVRFGGLPEAVEQRIAGADESALDALLDRIVVVANVDDL